LLRYRHLFATKPVFRGKELDISVSNASDEEFGRGCEYECGAGDYERDIGCACWGTDFGVVENSGRLVVCFLLEGGCVSGT
jgi:hypothetical protein